MELKRGAAAVVPASDAPAAGLLDESPLDLPSPFCDTLLPTEPAPVVAAAFQAVDGSTVPRADPHDLARRGSRVHAREACVGARDLP
ncbi:MAG TPA: hypothetical protein VFY73_11200, partial [Ideonella sp.]|uniref:hypothetical protein n=1 Tax=Ideonella sp. TaxID=1929293 RepID=UPI002E365939